MKSQFLIKIFQNVTQKVIIDSERVLFTDLNSTNGSFVNGVKVEVTIIKEGDKIALYDTILEVVNGVESMPMLGGEVGDAPPDDGSDESLDLQFSSPIEKLIYKADKYLENAAMPPFYTMTEKIDFKWLVGLFLLTTIFVTALLSTIPLMNIIQDTIELESKRRASSLAKTISTLNKEPLQTGSFSSASVELAYKEPGVKKAMIIRQSNGEIISPSRMSGQFPKIPAIHEARKITERPFHVFKANSRTIVAMHPIKFYSAKDGSELTRFYSVIVYDAKVLSVSSGKTLSLFVQTLFLSMLFGIVVFYFLYKIIEFPLSSLSRDLKTSLRSGRTEELKTPILLSSLKEIYVIASSILNRAGSGDDSASAQVVEVDRTFEIQNLVEMLGYASLVISNEDESIMDYNPLFEELTGLYDVKGQKIMGLSDQALQQNLEDLVERSRQEPDQIITNDFEFTGIPYEVKMHPVMGTSDISYFVCSFVPVEAE